MTRFHRIGRFLAVSLMMAMAAQALADTVRIGASAGVGRAYGQTYYELGGRLGTEIAVGLTPEVGLSYWGGSSPSFLELAPGVTWYVPLPLVRPYLGAFYAHDFVSSGLPNQDGVGLRGGIGVLGAGPLSLSMGLEYERRLSCSASCYLWWPEVVASVVF